MDQSVAKPMKKTNCWRVPILLMTPATVVVVNWPAGANAANCVAMVALVMVAG